jgi:hypothetical protein
MTTIEKIGAEFTVSGLSSESRYQSIARLETGDFIIVWTDYTRPNSVRDAKIVAQRFDASGARLGAEFEVAASSDRFLDTPDVTRLVAWWLRRELE